MSFLSHVRRETRGVAYTVVVWQLREVTILVSASMLAGSLQQQYSVVMLDRMERNNSAPMQVAEGETTQAGRSTIQHASMLVGLQYP